MKWSASLRVSQVMVHQPLGGVQGSSTNMEAAVESMVDYRNKLKQILMKHCSQSAEAVGELAHGAGIAS